MAKCSICNKSIVTGFCVCDDCYSKFFVADKLQEQPLEETNEGRIYDAERLKIIQSLRICATSAEGCKECVESKLPNPQCKIALMAKAADMLEADAETALVSIDPKGEDMEKFIREIREYHAVYLSNIPTMKHAHWEHLGGSDWCCSNCGFVIATEGSWDKPTKKHCEECGVKMDEEEFLKRQEAFVKSIKNGQAKLPNSPEDVRHLMQTGTVDPARCKADCPYFTPGEKTADEMFKELGYKESANVDRGIIYTSGSTDIYVTRDGNAIGKLCDDNGLVDSVSFNANELRAVCKLLDEMGVSKE